MSQILAVLIHIISFNRWSGNQKLQNTFCKALEDSGLKNPGVQYDPHSGGPRTYFAQLKCLGLIFERNNRIVYSTIAGEDLAKGKSPLPIMQEMLLRHQYPSAYGNLQQVRINPYIKVKPFLFVLELLNNPEIRYMTTDELMIPIIYGHNFNCLNLCINKILQMRSGKKIIDLIDNDNDLYLPRSSNTTNIKILDNIRDIANTCKNYLEASCLITVENARGYQSFIFNSDMKIIYQEAVSRADSYNNNLSSEEAFQRTYGAWNRIKDTRRLSDNITDTRSITEATILSQFYKRCGETIITGMPEDFVDEMVMDWGFPKNLVKESIEPHLTNTLDFYESEFIALSTGGQTKATKFEKVVCSLYQNKLQFKAKHTGQLRKTGKAGAFSDVFIIALDNSHCAVIDTKASPSYNLPSNDYRAMASDYIPHYKTLIELLNVDKSLKLEFATFVAGGFSGNVNIKLKQIKNQSGTECSAIRARDLLSLSKKDITKEKQEKIRKMFKQSKIITTDDFIV